jgi:hypothetical protein
MNIETIKELCDKYMIIDYTINPDLSINVKGNVHLEKYGLTKIPLKFGQVNGHFYCSYNQLTDMVGAPHTIIGCCDFFCNKLTTTLGCPKIIHSDFDLGKNPDIELTELPEFIGQGFFVDEKFGYAYREVINPNAYLENLRRSKKIKSILSIPNSYK